MKFIGTKEGRLYYLTGSFMRMSPAGLVQVRHVMVKDGEDDWPAPIGSVLEDEHNIAADEQLAEASGWKEYLPSRGVAAYLDLEEPDDE